MDAVEVVLGSRKAAARAGAPAAARLLAALMPRLSVAAPALAARIAEFLWFRLPTRQPPDMAAAAVLDGASPLPLQVDGLRIAGWSWGEGPVVLLQHGWGGHAGQLQAFVAPLVAKGYRVVAFDAPSHGASGPGAYGRHSGSLLEFAAVLLEAQRRLGPLHALAAHSGGAVAAVYALRRGLQAGRLVLLAPMTQPLRQAERFARMLGLGGEVQQRWQARAARRLGFRWEELEATQAPPLLSVPPPLLVIHDPQDREVPFADGADLVRAWPGARLIATAGLGHRRLLRDDGVIARALDFVTGRA